MQSKSKKIKDKIIGQFVNELKQSSYFEVDFKSALSKCLDELGGRRIEQIICYGLGSFRNGVDIASRYQLALLLLLYEFLIEQGEPLNSTVELYDPSFDELDQYTLSTFIEPTFKLITENEYCARKLITSDKNRCVLIYMPHLDKFFYNNLLGVNWNADSLGRLVVLGNSFHEMIDTETPSKRRSELYYMNQLVGNFEEKLCSKGTSRKIRNHKIGTSNEASNFEAPVALVEVKIDDTSFKHSDIFNNLSFHLIDMTWLKTNFTKLKELPDWTCVTTCPSDEWPD